MPVRHVQGTLHGFLRMETLDGKPLATGDLIQTVHGSEVTIHLTFHFRDGSLDDETTVFTQRETLHLVSDRHIQRGPFFPQQVEMSVTAAGQVTCRTTDKAGKQTEVSEHMDLPADLANGLPVVIMLNRTENDPELQVPLLAVDGKPLLVKLVIRAAGQESFTTEGVRHSANRFIVKPEVVGAKGMFASMLGKQPKEYRLWIAGGEAPVFLRSEGQLYNGGPLVRIEQVTPHFSAEP